MSKRILREEYPTITFKKLFHVGTMNANDKDFSSLEGEGLSISVCPDEWQEITPLQGDLYKFTKQNNCFLNYHELSEDHLEQLSQWGLENGYIEQCTVYNVYFVDGETLEDRYFSFTDYEEAMTEFEAMGEEDEDSFKTMEGFKATEKMIQRIKNNPSPSLTLDLLSTIFAEDVLHIDGVYWNDILDVDCLSAPRGVINLTSLKTWNIKKIKTL